MKTFFNLLICLVLAFFVLSCSSGVKGGKSLLFSSTPNDGWYVIYFEKNSICNYQIFDFRNNNFIRTSYGYDNVRYTLSFYKDSQKGFCRTSSEEINFNNEYFFRENINAIYLGDWKDDAWEDLNDLLEQNAIKPILH